MASKKEGKKIKTPLYEVERVVERSNDRVSQIADMLNAMTLRAKRLKSLGSS